MGGGGLKKMVDIYFNWRRQMSRRKKVPPIETPSQAHLDRNKLKNNHIFVLMLLVLFYLGHLREETDGERQSQAKSGETHQSVDGQDEPPLSLQDRKSERGREETPT